MKAQIAYVNAGPIKFIVQAKDLPSKLQGTKVGDLVQLDGKIGVVVESLDNPPTVGELVDIIAKLIA